MLKIKNISAKISTFIEEVVIYWNQPRPGEYVSYKEIVMLGAGWFALNFVIRFSIGFGVGNEFTGATLKMNNNELLIMGYICQVIGYMLVPFNSWLVDNLKSKHGKYRVYIKFAVPYTLLSLLGLWLPYEQLRDRVSRYLMIAALFVIGQVQGYVQGWLKTGVTNLVYVITPNSQERAKLMSITSIIYSLAPTILNIYLPLMVDVLPINANKYTMTYYRGTYTPLILFAPLTLCAFYGTKERLVIPKSRITKMSFANSIRSVAGNRIFWIKCFDAWNDFLEGAKGDIWDRLVYRAHITSSTVYGVLNTLCHNSQLYSMMLSPWAIKKFGKRKIKIFKNVGQVFLIAGIGFTYKSKFALVALFIINYINRFIDCGEVIDKAIESDMRDTQQYLVGERIDGSFGFVSSYANGAVGMLTGLFLPWVYKKCGFDGNDYSVLDVYLDYNPNLPLEKQTKNPDCVLYKMLDVLIAISVFGAVVDVFPWFFYDISEIGQKSMIRVIRLRTLVEDFRSKDKDLENFIEGCEVVFKARKYENSEKLSYPKNKMKAAKLLPKNTDEEKALRDKTIKSLKAEYREIEKTNEEIEISKFVMFELKRFSREFGRKQLELAEFIVSAGQEKFYKVYEKAIEKAAELPHSDVKEEKVWRRQEIRNARALKRSAELAHKYYPEGKISFSVKIIDEAFNMPDNTAEERKMRRKALKAANKAQNRYSSIAAPYLSALRTVQLAEGYADIDNILSGYDDIKSVVQTEKEKIFADAKRVAEERALDIERKRAQKRLGK